VRTPHRRQRGLHTSPWARLFDRAQSALSLTRRVYERSSEWRSATERLGDGDSERVRGLLCLVVELSIADAESMDCEPSDRFATLTRCLAAEVPPETVPVTQRSVPSSAERSQVVAIETAAPVSTEWGSSHLVVLDGLLDAGKIADALELYAALCAQTDNAPERRKMAHGHFGIGDERERRALDHRIGAIFDADPAWRDAFEARVSMVMNQFVERMFA